MFNYALRRLLLMIPTLLGITLVVFAVMAASPGGISSTSLVDGFGMKPAEKQALQAYYNRRYGLDQPAAVQYLRWLNNLSPVGWVQDESGKYQSFSFSKGANLGESIRFGRPVSDLLAERVPITLLLNLLSLPFIYAISIVVGVRSAVHRGSRFDVGANFVMLGLWSVPTMLTGVLLIGLFASDQFWHWFPTSGLSERSALDMPFLPHASSWRTLISLCAGLVLGAWLSLVAASMDSRRLRVGYSVLLSLVISWGLMASLGSPAASLGALLLVVFPMAILVPLALSEFIAWRKGWLTAIGAALGAGLALYLDGEGWLRGYLFDRVWHLVLPVICLSYGGFAFLARLTRSSMLENLRADFARTARAKGLPDSEVIWGHVFRNSLIPLITVSASLLPSLLAGSVVVESIFSIDGMGKLAVEAVKGRDRELVLSITFISGLLTLLSYLVADLLYALADPRVSYE